ncbi:MAG: 16S rRNA (cytosine(967)-C(5))-methyltransferase RsmB [Acidobacteria bacterium]|nr:16S rRNA (cytosine(967)-C(5))-methyltransferase RsmB [Acidobacteriota bacterium]
MTGGAGGRLPVSPARAAAFKMLMRIESADAYASELLHSRALAKLPPADLGLLTELVMGVLRWRGVLDERIAEHASQPPAKLDLEVLTALRLGAYQLLFLDRVPVHAAVNESVELTKRARKRSAAGIVNAVLRRLAAARVRGLSPQEDAGSLPASAGLAHPPWLVERWRENYGLPRAHGISAYHQVAPKTAIRVEAPAVLDELEQEGIRLKPGSLLRKAFVIEAGDITRTEAFRERRLFIQDEASQLVALLVGRGGSILDCCAAPGGKTRILAEQNPGSTLIALELYPRRALLLKRLVRAGHVRVIAADARQIPLEKKFDRVLVDAPCSGTGTLARNPEIKWRLKAEDIRRLESYQLQLFESAMEIAAPGGRLVYSTCSLEPEENQAVVERALTANGSFRVLDCRRELERLKLEGELATGDLDSLLSGPYLRTLPGVHSCDGFFAAILEKPALTPSPA